MKDVKNQAVQDGFKDVHASSFGYVQKNKDVKRPKYRYVMKVVETVESKTAVDSDVKLPWAALQKIAEKRRISGDLSVCGVKDVDMWVDAAYVDGVEQGARRLLT